MSGFVFLLVIDWLMRRTEEGENTGIRWNMTQKLGDLDFANDLTMLASKRAHMERNSKLQQLDEIGSTTGLELNANDSIPDARRGLIIYSLCIWELL